MNKQFSSFKRNLILLAFGVMIFGVLGVLASTLITDNAIQSPYVNTTNSNYKVARTADVTVCRGTSLLDDLYKSVTCNIVCPSTSNDCSGTINSAIITLNNYSSSIYFKDGVYPTNSQLDFSNKSNINIIGESRGTDYVYHGVYFNFTGSSGTVINLTNANSWTIGKYSEGANTWLAFKNYTGSTEFLLQQDGTLSLNKYAGSGNDYACFDDYGNIFRSNTAC